MQHTLKEKSGQCFLKYITEDCLIRSPPFKRSRDTYVYPGEVGWSFQPISQQRNKPDLAWFGHRPLRQTTILQTIPNLRVQRIYKVIHYFVDAVLSLTVVAMHVSGYGCSWHLDKGSAWIYILDTTALVLSTGFPPSPHFLPSIPLKLRLKLSHGQGSNTWIVLPRIPGHHQWGVI